MRISTSANVIAGILVTLIAITVAIQINGVLEVRNQRKQEQLAEGVSAAVLDIATLANEIQLRRSERAMRQFDQRISSLDDLLSELEQIQDAQLPAIRRMQRRVAEMRSAFEGLSNLEGTENAAIASRAPLWHSFLASSHTLASLSKRLSAANSRKITEVEQHMLTATIVAGALSIGLVVIVYIFFIVGVMSPLVGLRDRILKMADDANLKGEHEDRRGNEIREIEAEFDRRYAALKIAERAVAIHTANLERSNRDLEQFAYVASHDLRTPLRGIITTASWIEEDLSDVMNDDTRENMKLLKGRARRLDGLLNSLLEYSRASTRQHDTEDVNVESVLDEVILLLNAPAEIKIETRGELPTLRTIRVHVHQVLHNLLDNAIKHHDRTDGRITVSCRDAGAFYAFRVEDDGPGIAPEFHDKVMQIFQTLKRRDVYESSGMGLALVKRIIEQHGGTFAIESPLTDRGCAMCFSWPKRENVNADA